MRAPDRMEQLAGTWSGTCQLWRPWLPPAEQTHSAAATASVSLAAAGAVLTISYSWILDGAAQQGLLILGYAPEPNAVQSVWVDSWHMSEQFMLCHGQMEPGGAIDLLGSYPAPPGPDWGWRTRVDPVDLYVWAVVMFNIAPTGEEQRAFELHFAR
jgi:hypothetical protein